MNRTQQVELTLINRDITRGVSVCDASGFYYMSVGDKVQIIGVGCLLSIDQIDALKEMGFRLMHDGRDLPVGLDSRVGTLRNSGRTFTSYEFERAIGAFIPNKTREYTWSLSAVEKAAALALFFIFVANALRDAMHYASFSMPVLAIASMWALVWGIVLFRLRVSLSYTIKRPIGLA